MIRYELYSVKRAGVTRSRSSQSHITTYSQSASPSWCQAPIWDQQHFVFSLEIVFRQMRLCYFVAPSLTRGRVYNLLLLLVFASAVPLGYVFCHYQSSVGHCVYKIFKLKTKLNSVA
jgi:hypothetical protein